MRCRYACASITRGVSMARVYSTQHMHECERRLLRYFGSSRLLAELPMSGTSTTLQSYASESASAVPRALLFPSSSAPAVREDACPNAAGATAAHRRVVDEICAGRGTLGGATRCALPCASCDASVCDNRRLPNIRGADGWQRLQDMHSFRTLSNRFHNGQDSNKDSVDETYFQTIGDDLTDMWRHVCTAWQEIYDALSESTSAEQSRSSHNFPRSRPLLLPTRVLFLILFSHTRQSRAVTRAMHRIAERVHRLADSAQATRAAHSLHGHAHTVTALSSFPRTQRRSHTLSGRKDTTMAGSEATWIPPILLRAIPIYIGLTPPDELMYVDNSTWPSFSSGATASTPGPNVNQRTLCYARSGLYTLSAVLQCLANLPPAALTTTDLLSSAEKKGERQSDGSLCPPRLQRRVLVLSEAWLQPRSVAAIHQTRCPGEEGLCVTGGAGGSSAHCAASRLCRGARDSAYLVPPLAADCVGDTAETVTEVIPGVVGERLSEVELDAFARYVVCRALSSY